MTAILLLAGLFGLALFAVGFIDPNHPALTAETAAEKRPKSKSGFMVRIDLGDGHNVRLVAEVGELKSDCIKRHLEGRLGRWYPDTTWLLSRPAEWEEIL